VTLHILNYYWSGLDDAPVRRCTCRITRPDACPPSCLLRRGRAQESVRKIQSLGAPFLGQTAAGFLADVRMPAFGGKPRELAQSARCWR
jgi:hypothetical protein